MTGEIDYQVESRERRLKSASQSTGSIQFPFIRPRLNPFAIWVNGRSRPIAREAVRRRRSFSQSAPSSSVKLLCALALCPFFSNLSPAADLVSGWQGKKVPQLILANGTTYTDVTFTKVEADTITITHAGGILRIPMEALKPESQQALGYDPEKAAASAAGDARRTVADDGFVLIPGGSFTMGRASGDTDSSAPPVTVTVSTFYIQQTETTTAKWDEVRTWGASNGYTDLADGGGKAPNHPVSMVSWWDAVKWCNARSQKEGLTPVYMVNGAAMRSGKTEPTVKWIANGYRLPTEAEWEKAARGGVEGKRFPWGADTIDHSNANYKANSSSYSYDTSGYTTNTSHPSYKDGVAPYTSPVGSFAANGFGLYDMSGNVSEWCWDAGGVSYVDGATDPRGAGSNEYRVHRGGSWTYGAIHCRAASRSNNSPGGRNNDRGFRPARSSAP
jgi:formylglycine-generating enzyme required for sulfatase activity